MSPFKLFFKTFPNYQSILSYLEFLHKNRASMIALHDTSAYFCAYLWENIFLGKTAGISLRKAPKLSHPEGAGIRAATPSNHMELVEVVWTFGKNASSSWWGVMAITNWKNTQTRSWTRWKDYICWLAWEYFVIFPKELERMNKGGSGHLCPYLKLIKNEWIID